MRVLQVLLAAFLMGSALAVPVNSCTEQSPCALASQYCDTSEGTPGVCVDRSLCDPGTYAEPVATAFDADTSCLPCDDDCLTCFGPSDEQCTSCPAGRFMEDEEIEPEGEGDEPEELLFGHCEECTDQCPAGTFMAHPCTPLFDTVCKDCPASCPAGTRSPCDAIGTGNSDACVPCPSACATCAEGSCSTCFDGFVLQGGQCVACSTLMPGCALCSQPIGGALTCSLCQPGWSMVLGVCRSSVRSPPPSPLRPLSRGPPPPPAV